MKAFNILLGRSSIKNKITGAIISVVSIIAVFIIIYFPLRQKNEAMQGLKAKAQSLAVMLAYNVSPGLEFEDLQSAKEAIEGAKQNKDLSYIIICDSKDKVFASYKFEEGKKVLKRTRTEKTESFIDQEKLNVLTPIFSQKREIGYLAVGLSLSDLKREVAGNLRITFLVSIIIIILGILIATYLSKILSEPILKLTEAVRRLSSGEAEIKVELETEDEIGILAKAFNQMTDDLKNSREQLIQQEKMASVGQLAAGVAHELNNPLGGILGYSQFALEKITKKPLKDLTGDDIDTYTQYLKDIEHQSQRCKTIVQNLLKFARSSNKVAFDPLDLNSVLKDTLVFIHHQMEMGKVELITNLDQSPLKVMGNSNQLQQVFTNIILNAIQAMPDGGELIISTRKIEKEDNLPERVEIVFADTGCGIPQDNLNKVFEPFFTTKRVGEGTGLGLPVSYGIIKDHKGEILVESQLGKGAKFILWIPVLTIDKRSEAKRVKKVLKNV